MSSERWFSTKLRFVIMVEPAGGDTLNDCVYLLKAADFDAAFSKALSIGKSHQKEYRNTEGNAVQWKFMQIISLDVIPSDDLDRQEVYSEPVHLSQEEIIPFGAEFSPQNSKPLQTI